MLSTCQTGQVVLGSSINLSDRAGGVGCYQPVRQTGQIVSWYFHSCWVVLSTCQTNKAGGVG